jgi:hypothetical protein
MNIGKRIGVGVSAEVFLWKDHQVIKLFYSKASKVRVIEEAEVTKALHQAGLAVPAIDKVVEINGRQGIIGERIDGSSMLINILLKPFKIGYFARLLAELQTTIHKYKYNVSGIPCLLEKRKLQIQAAEILSEDKRQVVLDILDRLPVGESLCHGDFHPDNIILSPSKSIVIDWSVAVQGNSLADVAKTLLLLVIGTTPANHLTSIPWLLLRCLFCTIYLRHYMELTHVTWKQIQPWLLPEAVAWLSDCSSEHEKKFLLFIIEKYFLINCNRWTMGSDQK